ncbi:hypothetical protein [Blastococcus sp. CCUG 61487]|uniref:hypothetical protein n=1 Tax=Blastococcus sp. CCUG 61487 TaxID=1840703 RepID=UPI0010C15146|nr:hypothetical protein [Blastococcus sp. CCUG 61487]TKJ33605.1 hypothetical protein A6V29_15760 [Blastococcus sp. CCUG 61487]
MARPEMVLPPVGPDGVDREHADLGDVRVPALLGRYSDDERHARPVGYYHGRRPADGRFGDQPGPCNPTGQWGHNRHLFDALEVSEGDRYDADDQLLGKRFHLVLTCVRCGLVEAMRGQLDPDDAPVPGAREVTHLDPTPLQAGELLAQEIDRRHFWGDQWDVTWTIYRDGLPVGWLATQRGPRGKRYVAGAFGRRYDNSSQVEKGAGALAVLRKLAKQGAPEPVGATPTGP